MDTSKIWYSVMNEFAWRDKVSFDFRDFGCLYVTRSL